MNPFSLKHSTSENTTVNQSVSQNQFFSKAADRIFMKFHLKFWFLQNEKVTQPGKNLVMGKKPEITLKVGFFGVSKKFIPLTCYFWVYMMHRGCLYDSSKATFFEKFCFSSSGPMRF